MAASHLAGDESGSRPLTWLGVETMPHATYAISTVPGDLAIYTDAQYDARLGLQRDLLSALHEEPVEAGCTHPAESIIQDVLHRYGRLGASWIEALYREKCASAPALAADLLVCVGRLRPEDTGDWGLGMVRAGLAHRSVEVREAGVRALENWDVPQSVPWLTTYAANEPCGWLADYARQIVDDLQH